MLWLPQLLSCATRPEFKHVISLLGRIAKDYPQALYYTVRTAYLDVKPTVTRGPAASSIKEEPATDTAPTGSKRAQDDEATQSSKRVKVEPGSQTDSIATSSQSSSASSVSSSQSALQQAKGSLSQLSQLLRTRNGTLFTQMESISEELIHRFKPSVLELTLRALDLLLVACLRNASHELDNAADLKEDVSSLHRGMLSMVSASQPADSLHKHKAQLLDDFKDYSILNTVAGLLLLRRWYTTLSAEVEQTPNTARLEDISPLLGYFTPVQNAELFLPSEHLFQRPNSNLTGYHRIERFLPRVDIVRKSRNPDRRIYIRTRSGHVFPFLVQNAHQPHQRSEERLHQLFRIMNDLLDQRKESRKRNLQFHLTRMVPLAQHVRLIHEDSSSVSLEQMFVEHCKAKGTSIHDPIFYSLDKRREFLSQPQKAQPNRDIKKELFEEIRRLQVPATILTDYMKLALPDYASHWVFRTTFTRQLAFASFASRILFLNHGPPNAINVLCNSGNLVYSELYPHYEDSVVASIDRVYFRLTPNLVRFMNKFVNELLLLCRLHLNY